MGSSNRVEEKRRCTGGSFFSPWPSKDLNGQWPLQGKYGLFDQQCPSSGKNALHNHISSSILFSFNRQVSMHVCFHAFVVHGQKGSRESIHPIRSFLSFFKTFSRTADVATRTIKQKNKKQKKKQWPTSASSKMGYLSNRVRRTLRCSLIISIFLLLECLYETMK